MAALNEARSAHEERNRVVHDRWIPETVDGVIVTDTFSTQRFDKNRALPVSVTTRTIEGVFAVEVALRHIAVRLDHLAYAITLSDTRSEDWMQRMIAGEFDDPSNSGTRIIDE